MDYLPFLSVLPVEKEDNSTSSELENHNKMGMLYFVFHYSESILFKSITPSTVIVQGGKMIGFQTLKRNTWKET
jgi:hypothetical protein